MNCCFCPTNVDSARDPPSSQLVCQALFSVHDSVYSWVPAVHMDECVWHAGGGSSKKRKKDRQGEAPAQQQLVPKGPPLVQFSLQEIDAARQLLASEVEVVRGAMGHSGCGQAEYLEAWRVVADDFVVDDKVWVCWVYRV